MTGPQDLNWFLELAERGHMTRTSESLGISQPALSHWLKKLEHDLKKPLFRRGPQGMELTAFGEKLRASALPLKQSWQDFIQAVETDDQELRARFQFGIHASVALFALPPILKSLQQLSRGIRLQLQHGLSRHITEDIVSRRLDIGLVVNPQPNPDLVIKELYKDHVKAFAIKQHKNQLIVTGNIGNIQLLRSKLRDLPEVQIETSSLEVAAHLALAGEGIALLPQRVALALGGKRLVPVEEISIVDRHCLVYRPSLRETLAGQALIKAVREAKI